MRIESQLQLLAKIEDALALADAEQAYDVALWLDRARIAAGGPAEIDPKRLTFFEDEPDGEARVPYSADGEGSRDTA